MDFPMGFLEKSPNFSPFRPWAHGQSPGIAASPLLALGLNGYRDDLLFEPALLLRLQRLRDQRRTKRFR